jgi:hypothetical protein
VKTPGIRFGPCVSQKSLSRIFVGSPKAS